MAQFSTNSDFSTDANATLASGGAVSAITGWTVINPVGGTAGNNSTYTITTEAGAEGGKYCAAQETGWDANAHFLQFDAAGTIGASTAAEFLLRFRHPALSGDETLVGKFLYSGGNYYSLRVFASGAAQLYYYQGTSAWSNVGSADSTPNRNGTPAALTTATWYWARVVKTAAGLWSWKIWSGAIGDEPAGWSLGDGGAGGTSNTSVTTGATGIGMRSANQDIDYDWYSVGTAGDSAPSPGGAAPTITNIDGDNLVQQGQASVQINITGGDASGNVVTISPSTNIADVNALTPAIASESATQITLTNPFVFPTGVAEGGTAYVFVTSTGGASAAHAFTRQDITAPSISAATATSITPTGATSSVTTNEANGQAWMVKVPSAEATPVAAQIKLGQNAAGGSPVEAKTVNPVTGTTITASASTGLTPATSYKDCWVQEDAEGNTSNVTTHTFSTAALPTFDMSGATQVIKDNTETVQASLTGVTVDIYSRTTGDRVGSRKTGLAIDASGNLENFTEAAASVGTGYRLWIDLGNGKEAVVRNKVAS